MQFIKLNPPIGHLTFQREYLENFPFPQCSLQLFSCSIKYIFPEPDPSCTLLSWESLRPLAKFKTPLAFCNYHTQVAHAYDSFFKSFWSHHIAKNKQLYIFIFTFVSHCLSVLRHFVSHINDDKKEYPMVVHFL